MKYSTKDMLPETQAAIKEGDVDKMKELLSDRETTREELEIALFGCSNREQIEKCYNAIKDVIKEETALGEWIEITYAHKEKDEEIQEMRDRLARI